MAAHLAAFAGAVGVPFGHILGPLIIYLIKGHESEFIGEHSRASLNYQITISILGIIAVMVGIGFALSLAAESGMSTDTTAFGMSVGLLWIAIAGAAVIIVLLSVIFIIMGAIAASQGRPYTYPLAIRFLR